VKINAKIQISQFFNVLFMFLLFSFLAIRCLLLANWFSLLRQLANYPPQR
jgi:hypothetical protein